jgi:hypothetical protein
MYGNESRADQPLDDKSQVPRDVEPVDQGEVVSFPYLGGLHHRYRRAA